MNSIQLERSNPCALDSVDVDTRAKLLCFRIQSGRTIFRVGEKLESILNNGIAWSE